MSSSGGYKLLILVSRAAGWRENFNARFGSVAHALVQSRAGSVHMGQMFKTAPMFPRCVELLECLNRNEKSPERTRIARLAFPGTNYGYSVSCDSQQESDMADLLEIMVVEDDQQIQRFIEEALSDGGFEPAIASSGEEALALLTEGESISKYRLILIDIKLGKDRISGWDVARRARAANPDLPVVYITGVGDEEWAVQGVPGSVLLTKPFAPAQLITAVSQLLITGSSTK
jgi:CheY-like chemotaxis protein